MLVTFGQLCKYLIKMIIFSVSGVFGSSISPEVVLFI